MVAATRRVALPGSAVLMANLWAGQWYSKNKLDGVTRHFLYSYGQPMLFPTRRECREYIRLKYEYIKSRPDLQAEPHGWRMPRAVKIELVIVPTFRDPFTLTKAVERLLMRNNEGSIRLPTQASETLAAALKENV